MKGHAVEKERGKGRDEVQGTPMRGKGTNCSHMQHSRREGGGGP